MANVPGGATLAEGWRFGAWAIQPTPNPQSGTRAVDNTLLAVSCASPRACTAVDNSTNARAPLLAERFDGTVWRLQPIAVNPRLSPFLEGVACPSVRLCIAVGGSGLRPVGSPLAVRWARKATSRRQYATLPSSLALFTTIRALGVCAGRG